MTLTPKPYLRWNKKTERFELFHPPPVELGKKGKHVWKKKLLYKTK